MTTHPGIRIRVTTPAGVVVECDSDFAYYANVFSGAPVGQWRTILRHLQAAAEPGQLVGRELLDDNVDAGGGPPVCRPDELLRLEFCAVDLDDYVAPDDPGELLETTAAPPPGGDGRRRRMWPWSRGDRCRARQD